MISVEVDISVFLIVLKECYFVRGVILVSMSVDLGLKLVVASTSASTRGST